MRKHSVHPRRFIEGILNTIREPLVVLDQSLVVLTASRSFYNAFRVVPEVTEGRPICTLGNGQWDIPALRDLLSRIIDHDSTIEGFEVEHEFPDVGLKTFLLNARRIRDSGDPTDTILLAMEDISERKQYEKELRRLALTDPLTGLANRTRFREALSDTLKLVRRFEIGMSLLVVDMDGFKRVNDTYGHPVGDVVLKNVARILADGVREVDTVARLGGDEFAVILQGVARNDDAEVLGRRYIGRLREPMVLPEATITIGACIGIVNAPDHGDDAENLVRRADLALYRAKAVGPNALHTYASSMGR